MPPEPSIRIAVDTGGTGGGIYMQTMVDRNVESGFRKSFAVTPTQVYRSTGSKFADKPHAIIMLDEDNPGTVPVTLTVETADGSGTETITVHWPRARIIVVGSEIWRPRIVDARGVAIEPRQPSR